MAETVTVDPSSDEKQKSGGTRRDVVGACPLDCPDGCSWRVTVEGGKAVRLRGNSDHPFTRGGLCKKVNPWLTYAADPSRLLSPMRRRGPKGSGTFESVSWDDALAEMAERLGAVAEQYGGSAIWPFVGTGNVGWIQGASGFSNARLWNRLGAANHLVSICSISGHVGLGYSSGLAASFDPEALGQAGIVLLWGSNTLVANQHLWPFVEEARANGAEIVAIDPVRTRTAVRADRHLALRPGTDGALALGLARALIDAGGADTEYLRRLTVGWDDFAASLQSWTVERTAVECGLEPAQVQGLANLIATRRPLAIKLGQGMQRHAYGGQAARVVSCLPAITGAYDHPAGGLNYSTGASYQFNTGAYGQPEARPNGYGRLLAATHLGKNLLDLDDPPVKALVIAGANPIVSNPQTDLVCRGLSRDDLFTVAIDLYPTETTAYADLVLPSTMQHEQTELNDSFAHLYVNWNEPAIEAPGMCLSHTEILRRLAVAMGLGDPDLQASDGELAEALLDTDAFRKHGINLQTLRSQGFARLPNTDDFGPTVGGFPTSSGRFEFVSDRAEKEGHGRLPNYRPAAESEVGPGHYVLVAHGSDFHVNSVFAGTDRVRSATSEPPIVICADDAVRDDLADGQAVTVSNERGSFRAVIRIGADARPGVAATTKGWWGQGLNATVVERDSDMGLGAVFHDNVVAIGPAG
ncbi:MAG: anaerobic selenocysteine-containing dehydrogenase [Acidimicrobiales bacterium]